MENTILAEDVPQNERAKEPGKGLFFSNGLYLWDYGNEHLLQPTNARGHCSLLFRRVGPQLYTNYYSVEICRWSASP